MRLIASLLCVALVGSLEPGYAGDDKKAVKRPLTEEASTLGTQPKNGWVTAEKIKVQPWFTEGPAEVRLVVRFQPDAEAIKKGKPIGKVIMGVELSKEGQAEVMFHPAEGTYELIETKEGRVLQVILLGVPDKEKPFEKKLDKVEFKVSYQLDEGKLTFPKGLDTDYWSKWPATVKRKEAVRFDAK